MENNHKVLPGDNVFDIHLRKGFMNRTIRVGASSEQEALQTALWHNNGDGDWYGFVEYSFKSDGSHALDVKSTGITFMPSSYNSLHRAQISACALSMKFPFDVYVSKLIRESKIKYVVQPTNTVGEAIYHYKNGTFKKL